MQVPEGNERAELKCQCATRFKTGIARQSQVPDQIQNRARTVTKCNWAREKRPERGCTLKWKRPALMADNTLCVNQGGRNHGRNVKNNKTAIKITISSMPH